MISVLVVAKNEEGCLSACLEAVRWSDDVVVVDDNSSDRTAEIARSFGARVVRFDSAGQELLLRRFSLSEVKFCNEWVYNPDADEIPTAELVTEMHRRVREAGEDCQLFRVRFKTMFLGKWIRHASLYPTWVARLFKPERVQLERSTNLAYSVEGREGRLQEHFLHFTFQKGLEAWFEKHNRYSSAEAAETVAELVSGRILLRGCVSRDPVQRRRALKNLSLRLPARPTLRFLYMYFLRAGCLDGRPGLLYCRLLANYERLICWKALEIRRRRAGLSI